MLILSSATGFIPNPSRGSFSSSLITAAGVKTNFTFQANTTYYIRQSIHLYGTTVLHGGAVLKFARTGCSMFLHGEVNCLTAPGRPAILTAEDDDSVGAIIPGSTGMPEGFYAHYAIACTRPGGSYDLHHLGIRHARYGFALFNTNRVRIRHGQIGRVGRAFAWLRGSAVEGENLLLHDLNHAFWGNGPGRVDIQNATFHRMPHLGNHPNLPLFLTNCLLVAVAQLSDYVGDHVAVAQEDEEVFVTIEGTGHYLPTHSPYRQAGTPAMNAALRKELRRLTTQAPLLLDTDITLDGTLGPRLEPGPEIPDLGYHYEPVDYAIRGVTLREAVLNLENGCTLALASPARDLPGLTLGSGATLNSHGSAGRPNRILPLHSVLEELPWPARDRTMVSCNSVHPQTPSQIRLRFTQFPLLASDSLFDFAGNPGVTATLTAQDCQVQGGAIENRGSWSDGMAVWINNLFEGVDMDLARAPGGGVWLGNNTFLRGRVLLGGLADTFWLSDNFFDATDLRQEGAVNHDFNAYRQAASRWEPPAAHDRVLNSAEPLEGFEPGLLGPYYVPATGSPLAALIDAGSRSAAEAGLYHHTVRTTDLPELASTVDIGFHYVAGGGGPHQDLPHDSDQDGLADYEEDRNGNGLFDPDFAEHDWLTPDVDGKAGSRSIDLELFTSLL